MVMWIYYYSSSTILQINGIIKCKNGSNISYNDINIYNAFKINYLLHGLICNIVVNYWGLDVLLDILDLCKKDLLLFGETFPAEIFLY